MRERFSAQVTIEKTTVKRLAVSSGFLSVVLKFN